MRNTMRTPRPAQLTDDQLEHAIRFAYRALAGHPSVKGKIESWHLLRKLVRSRSVAAITRLERERGLVRS